QPTALGHPDDGVQLITAAQSGDRAVADAALDADARTDPPVACRIRVWRLRPSDACIAAGASVGIGRGWHADTGARNRGDAGAYVARDARAGDDASPVAGANTSAAFLRPATRSDCHAACARGRHRARIWL